MEKTIRGNGKWAKITGKRGKWTVAKGWEGSFTASKIEHWPVKYGAEIAAKHWLEY